MQHIQIIAVGNLREKAFAAACGEYQKRLGAFCRLTITEIPEGRLSANPSQAEIDRCLREEGERILKKLPPRAFLFALCIEGEQLPSSLFADRLAALAQTHSEIAFVIGGSHGLSDPVKAAAGLRFSMSAMTFPHQLARVMLLEQVYRGFSILRGTRYHK